ncbi:MAG: hypothetical protein M0C28_06510 [Candidatus Moduliflexus flocculans]|nr:hypothetical protein [Candidatus Moduliflexus flocculans]
MAEPPADYRVAPADKSNMAKYLFGGFERCLYPAQKFDSEAERKLAVILERDAIKWFRPAKGQFQIFYRARSGSPRIPAGFRRGDGRHASSCWNPRPATRWMIRSCRRRRNRRSNGARTPPIMRRPMAANRGVTC